MNVLIELQPNEQHDVQVLLGLSEGAFPRIHKCSITADSDGVSCIEWELRNDITRKTVLSYKSADSDGNEIGALTPSSGYSDTLDFFTDSDIPELFNGTLRLWNKGKSSAELIVLTWGEQQ